MPMLSAFQRSQSRQYVFFVGGCSHAILLGGLGLRKLLVQETCAVPFFCQKIMLRHAFLKSTDAWLDRHQKFAGGISVEKNSRAFPRK